MYDVYVMVLFFATRGRHNSGNVKVKTNAKYIYRNVNRLPPDYSAS